MKALFRIPNSKRAARLHPESFQLEGKFSFLHSIFNINTGYRGLFLSACFIIFSLIGNAAAKTWTGATSTDWNTAGNWSPSGVPVSGDDVTIPTSPSGGRMPSITTGSFTIKSLIIQTGATLTQSGGTLLTSGANSSVTGTFDQSAGTYLSDNTLTVNSGGLITQSGTGIIHMANAIGTNPTDAIIIAANGTITQSGGTIDTKDFTGTAGSPNSAFNQSGGTFRVYHDYKNKGNYNATGGTIQFSGTGGGATFPVEVTSTTTQFFDVLIDSGIDPGFGANQISSFNVAGNWTNNSTSPDLVTKATTVIFNGSANQTIGGSQGTSFRNLTINKSGGTATLAQNTTLVSGDLTVSGGTLDLSSYTLNRSAAGGTLTIASGILMKLASGFPANFSTVLFNNSSTVEYYGTGSQTIPAFNYGNLVSSSSGARVLASSGTIGVAGTFTPGSNSYTLTGSTVNFNGANGQTIAAFNYNNLSSSNNSRILPSGATVGIAGSFSPGSGNYTITGSTVDFNGPTASTVPVLAVSSGANYNNLKFTGTANAWTMGGAMTIGGDLTISATGSGKVVFNNSASIRTFTLSGDYIQTGGAVDLASSTGRTDLNIAGNINHSGGTSTFSGSTGANCVFYFNGGGTQTITLANLSSFTYINYTINSGSTLQLGSNINLVQYSSSNYAGLLTVSNGGKIIFPASYTVSMGGGTAGVNPTFNLNSGGTLITANASGVNGSVSSTNMTRTFNNAANYEFTGATGQNTGFVTTTMNNITVNLTGVLNLGADITVNGTLTLSNGSISIPTGNTINIASGNAVGGSGFGASKQIITQVNTTTGAKGWLRMGNIGGTTIFPVGNGTYYLPATLAPSATFDFSVCAFQGATSNGEPNGTAFNAVSKAWIVDAIWLVNKNSGVGSANLSTAWPAALEGSGFVTLANNEIGISQYIGSAWDLALGSGNQVTNIATRSALTTFTKYGVDKVGIPLPLKFGNIKVSQQQENIRVDWTSLTEINTKNYEIERSADGRNFTSIGLVLATGNNYSRADYSWLDQAALSGTSFYRIKAVDIDGRYTYSSIVRITINTTTDLGMAIYPNPVTDKKIAVSVGNAVAGNYLLSIYDIKGTVIYRQTLSHAGGAFSQSIQLPASVDKGMYSLRLSGNAGNRTGLFLVQ